MDFTIYYFPQFSWNIHIFPFYAVRCTRMVEISIFFFLDFIHLKNTSISGEEIGGNFSHKGRKISTKPKPNKSEEIDKDRYN